MHEWNVWREAKLPAGKVLIPGVIDSTTNFVEHPEVVADRIQFLGRGRGAGPETETVEELAERAPEGEEEVPF